MDLPFITSIFHETTHHLSFIQGFQNGSSSDIFRNAILMVDNNDTQGIINKLLKQVTTPEHYTWLRNRNNIDQVASELGEYMYLLTGGELNSAMGSYIPSMLQNREFITGYRYGEKHAQMAGFGKTSGFLIDKNMIKGYGKFDYVKIPLTNLTFEKSAVLTTDMKKDFKKETFDMSFSKTKRNK